MQNAKCKIILESIVKLVNLRSLGIYIVKFIKLPILIKLLTFLLPGIVFDTYDCEVCALLFAEYRFRYPRVRGERGVDTRVFPLVCRVLFSIPMTARCALSCLLGIVFDTQEGEGMFLCCD